MKTHKIFNLVIVSILVFSLLGVPAPVLAQEPQPTPFIIVVPDEDNVFAFNWPLGALLEVEIANPTTPQIPLYTGSLLVVGSEDFENGLALKDIFDIQPGHLVTVMGGNTVREHTVTHLTVTNIDTNTDTVSGTGYPGAMIHVGAMCDDTGCVSRNINVDENGNWVADFSVPVSGHGDAGRVFDIRPGMASGAYEFDEDEDATNVGWDVPYPEPAQCQPGDTATGTVFEHDGTTPVPFASIQIDDYNSGVILFTSTADQNGQFGCYLPDGDYRLMAWTDPYTHTQEYYNEATDVNATPVHISTGTQFANINFTISPIPVIEHFTFNLQNLLLRDLVVRQAIALGTDRQRLLNGAFLPNGIYGMVSNSIVPSEHWASASASQLELYPFDPAEARTILEAAGWIDRDSDGFRENAEGTELAFTFKTRDTAFRMASGEIFRENMADIGIRINTEYLPDLQEITDQRDFDIAEFGWVSGWDNEPNLDLYFTDSPLNIGGYSNIAYDSAIANARTELDDAGRLPYLIEAQSILTDDLPILPLFTRYEVTPIETPTGSNITVSPETYLDIAFDEVTEGGVTTVLPTSIDPTDLPPDFQWLGQAYDIGTNATFTTAQVCFTYDDTGLTSAQESAVRLLHLENNAWVDVTDSGYPDTVNNIVCGTVTSFSPFAITYAPSFPGSRMEIDIYGNHIFASDWTVGSEITVSFDIPGTEEEWDYNKTVTVPEGWGAWCQFQIDIDPAEFRIAAGQVVRITDGSTTRQATIPDLTVTSEDPTADTLTGTAVPGSTVNLWTMSSETGVVQRNALANNNGVWFADFAHPGTGSDEQGTFDVIPGTGFFWVSQPISDFVGIKFMWDFGPYFHVFPEDKRIETYVWPIGANLTLTIDDPATPQNPDVTRTQENLAWQTNFEELGTILPGFIVSITDGLVTKTHIVTDLTVTGADSQADTVAGTTEPGNMVDLRICCGNNGWVDRHVSAGDDRIWLADFSVPGEGENEQDVYDIHPGEEGDVQQADIDGDTTALRWRAPNPATFMLNVNNASSWRGLDAWNWPLGTQVTLTVDDPSTLQNPDYTEVQTMMEPNPGQPSSSHAMYMQDYDLEGHFEGHPGFMITLSDGIHTKSMIVPRLAITGYDVLDDTISGIADPFARVLVVGPCSLEECSNPAEIEVIADGNGYWSANFADIQPGQGFEAMIYDADRDITVLRDWSVRLDLKGFYQPVDMNGVYNIVKGGSTVPLKFEIFAGATELMDTSYITGLTYVQRSCEPNAITDVIEATVAGTTGLRYDSAAGQFIYNWKTPSNAGKCYRLTLTTMDGSLLTAFFKLK